jgi:hypothetical protein
MPGQECFSVDDDVAERLSDLARDGEEVDRARLASARATVAERLAQAYDEILDEVTGGTARPEAVLEPHAGFDPVPLAPSSDLIGGGQETPASEEPSTEAVDPLRLRGGALAKDRATVAVSRALSGADGGSGPRAGGSHGREDPLALGMSPVGVDATAGSLGRLGDEVLLKSFPASGTRPPGMSLASREDALRLERFLEAAGRDHQAGSFLLDGPAENGVPGSGSARSLKVLPLWSADGARGGSFFLGVLGAVESADGRLVFSIAAHDGGRREVDAVTLARLLSADPWFARAMNEGAASVTVFGWDIRVPAGLGADLARELGVLLGREVSVYTATGAVVESGGQVVVAEGGHWDVSGHRELEHAQMIVAELSEALAQEWHYARPGPAAAPVEDSDRYHTLRLVQRASEALLGGLARGVLSLEGAYQVAREHSSPSLVLGAAIDFITRDEGLAASVSLIRDAWREGEPGSERWRLVPLAPQTWDRFGGAPGPATRIGRSVVRDAARNSPGPLSVEIRPTAPRDPDPSFEMAAMARRLAEGTRGTLAGITEHADIVVYDPGTRNGLASVAERARDRLLSLTAGYLVEIGIAEGRGLAGDIASQVVLRPRPVGGAEDPADPRVEIWVQSRSDLILSEYPWLPDVNPHRDDVGSEYGDAFRQNCIMASFAVDMTLETGHLHQAPGSDPLRVRDIYGWAESHDRPLMNMRGGLRAITEVMTAAPPGARALIDVQPPSGRGHTFNVVTHPRLGPVILDGQNGGELQFDRIAHWGDMWLVPMTDGIQPRGTRYVYISSEQYFGPAERLHGASAGTQGMASAAEPSAGGFERQQGTEGSAPAVLDVPDVTSVALGFAQLEERITQALASFGAVSGDPGLSECLVRLESVRGALFPRGVYPSGTVDDMVIGSDTSSRPEDRLAPGSDWRRVADWQGVADALAQREPGSVAFVLARRLGTGPDVTGHAWAAYRLPPGDTTGESTGAGTAGSRDVAWIEVLNSEGGRVSFAPPADVLPVEARAVIVDPSGRTDQTALPALASSDIPGAALTDPAASHAYGGYYGIGFEFEDSRPMVWSDGVVPPQGTVLATHPSGMKIVVDARRLFTGADGALYVRPQLGQNWNDAQVGFAVSEIISPPLQPFDSGSGRMTLSEGFDRAEEIFRYMAYTDRYSGPRADQDIPYTPLTGLLMPDRNWTFTERGRTAAVGPKTPDWGIFPQFTVSIPIRDVGHLLAFLLRDYQGPQWVFNLLSIGRDFARQVARRYAEKKFSIGNNEWSWPLLSALPEVDEVYGYAWLAFTDVGAGVMFQVFRSVSLDKNSTPTALRNTWDRIHGTLRRSIRGFLAEDERWITDAFRTALGGLGPFPEEYSGNILVRRFKSGITFGDWVTAAITGYRRIQERNGGTTQVPLSLTDTFGMKEYPLDTHGREGDPNILIELRRFFTELQHGGVQGIRGSANSLVDELRRGSARGELLREFVVSAQDLERLKSNSLVRSVNEALKSSEPLIEEIVVGRTLVKRPLLRDMSREVHDLFKLILGRNDNISGHLEMALLALASAIDREKRKPSVDPRIFSGFAAASLQVMVTAYRLGAVRVLREHQTFFTPSLQEFSEGEEAFRGPPSPNEFARLLWARHELNRDHQNYTNDEILGALARIPGPKLFQGRAPEAARPTTPSTYQQLKAILDYRRPRTSHIRTDLEAPLRAGGPHQASTGQPREGSRGSSSRPGSRGASRQGSGARHRPYASATAVDGPVRSGAGFDTSGPEWARARRLAVPVERAHTWAHPLALPEDGSELPVHRAVRERLEEARDGGPVNPESRSDVHSGFAVRRFMHEGQAVTDLTIRVAIRPAPDVTPEEVAAARAAALAGAEHLNAEGVVPHLNSGDRLHVTVLFTGGDVPLAVHDQGEPHLTVDLVNDDSGMTQARWQASAGPLRYAHEIAHQIGLRDNHGILGALMGEFGHELDRDWESAGLTQDGLRQRDIELLGHLIGDDLPLHGHGTPAVQPLPADEARMPARSRAKLKARRLPPEGADSSNTPSAGGQDAVPDSGAIDAASGAWKRAVRDYQAVVADALAQTEDLLAGGPVAGPSSEPDPWRAAQDRIDDAEARLDEAEGELLELARRAGELAGPPADGPDEQAYAEEDPDEPVPDEGLLRRATGLLGVPPTVIGGDGVAQQQLRESVMRVARLLRDGRDREAADLAAALAEEQGFLSEALPGGVQPGSGLSVAGVKYTQELGLSDDPAAVLATMVADLRQDIRSESEDGQERPHTLPLSREELARLNASWEGVERKLRKMIVAPTGERDPEGHPLIPGGPVGKHPDFGAKTETGEYLNATNLARFLLGWTEAKPNRHREKELAQQIEANPVVNLVLDSVLRRMWDGLSSVIAREKTKPKSAQVRNEILRELRTGRLENGRPATRYLSHFHPASPGFEASNMPKELEASVWEHENGLRGMLKEPYSYPFREKIMGIHDFVEYFTVVEGSSGAPIARFLHPTLAQYAFTLEVDEHGRRVRGPDHAESERPVGWVQNEAGEWTRTRHALDESSPWVTLARERRIPIWDGPSFTAARLMKYVELVGGGDLEKAAVAWAMAAFWRLHYDHRVTPAHTFHEVLDIAQNFGVRYSLNKPYAGIEDLTFTSLEADFTRRLTALETAASGALANSREAQALLDKARQFTGRLRALVTGPGEDPVTSVKTLQEAVRLIKEMRKITPASAVEEVLRFGADGIGRRVNLADLATTGQIDAIARGGGLANLKEVEALADRIATAFKVPTDGPAGPAADVALTLTFPAGRTPDSITSSAQLVKAVATKLQHPVFLQLEEIGAEFKICY